MQLDIVINVKEPDINDDVVVPGTSADAPNTGYLSVNSSTSSTNGVDANIMTLSLVGVIILAIIAVFVLIKKYHFSLKPIFKYHKRTVCPLVALAMLVSIISCFGLKNFSNTDTSSIANATGDNNENTLAITVDSTSKIDVTLEDDPVYAYMKNTVTVTSSTEAGYTLTANIVSDDKDLINTTNSEASEARITGLENTSPQSLTDNTWGIALTEPVTQDSSVFLGLPTEGEAPLTLVSKDVATPENDTTDVYLGTYVTPDLPYGTYSGVTVTYTAVANDPLADSAILDTGQTVNAKLKSLAATVVNGEETTIIPEFDIDGNYDSDYAYDEYIKSIEVHLETPAPAGFIPTEANTISSSDSQNPIYIVFDNTHDAGIMHFYTEGTKIVLPSDSSFMFYMLYELTEIPTISDWNTSRATDMSCMFYEAGWSATTFSLDLSSWVTSNVTDMSYMFYYAGTPATTWSIGDLSSWKTSNVTDMNNMFVSAGSSATTWSIGDLSSWEISNVTDMSNMFMSAGSSATTWSIGDLSSWKTSNVTNMGWMFLYAGYSATDWSIGDLSGWNTSNVENMRGMFSYAGYSASTFTLDISSWKTSNVTGMDGMFSHAGYFATTWSVGDLSSWNTSDVTDMSYMFYYAGYSATAWSVGNLSSWKTSNVTSMGWMFHSAGYSATTFTLDLSSWNTSSVTDIRSMFAYAGYSATAFTLDLSSWNTSSVTNSMSNTFSYAGRAATTWSVTIPQTNGNDINNTASRIYGKTTSTYGTPPSGKSFTLVQP